MITNTPSISKSSPPFIFGMSEIDNPISFFGHNQCTKSDHINKVVFLTIDYFEVSIFLKSTEVRVGLSI
ncbi:hypothetical protein LguiA_013044 [Lonicera macranthoides]